MKKGGNMQQVIPLTITLNDGTVITPKEVPTLIASMERQLMVKDNIIAGLEELHIDAVNDLLKLARENDILTEEMFNSPKLHAKEHQV